MPIAHTIARIFKSIQQMSDMVMELQTTWDSKGLAAKIATIIQADVMIVFLSAVKNALNIVQKLTEEMTMRKRFPDTLCWSCKNAVPSLDGKRGCSWSRHFKPVDGWTADPIEFAQGYKYNNSYCVYKCPEYIKG